MRIPHPEFSDLEGCFIAGGAVLSIVTRQPISDYDIYPKTVKDLEKILLNLVEDYGCFVINISDRCITLKSNDVKNENDERMIVQVITTPYQTAQDIFDSFDFTVCMGAFDCDTKEYVFDDAFWPDVASKSLRFNAGTRYPMASLIRTIKYKEKGYHLSKSQLMKIAYTAMVKGLPSSWSDVESQVGGTYGRSVRVDAKGEEFSLYLLFEILDRPFSFVEEPLDEKISNFDPRFVIATALGNGYYWKYDSEELDPPAPHASMLAPTEGYIFFDSQYNPIHTTNLEDGERFTNLLQPADPEVTITCWKSLVEKDGGYAGGIYSKKTDVVYSLGEDTVCLKNPFLFAYLQQNMAKNGWVGRPYGRFETKVKNLRALKDSNKVIQADTLRLVELF